MEVSFKSCNDGKNPRAHKLKAAQSNWQKWRLVMAVEGTHTEQKRFPSGLIDLTSNLQCEKHMPLIRVNFFVIEEKLEIF